MKRKLCLRFCSLSNRTISTLVRFEIAVKTWERELFTFSCPWRHLINERESPGAKTDNGDTSCFYHGDFMGKSFTFDSRCGLRGVIHFILAKKGFITTRRLARSCHAQICYNYIIVCSRTLTPFSSDGREVLYKV